jgi:hypothetical protein
MEEFEISYSLDDETQFWRELDDIVAVECSSHQLIDNTLRSYLHFTTNFKDDYLNTEHDIAHCSQKLLLSDVFEANKDYVRIQMVYSLLQEDEAATLHIIASFLLLDGRHNEATFEMMNSEGCFPKLLELIKQAKADNAPRWHRLLLDLLYEMSRLQRISAEDLGQVDDEFVASLFQIIERVSDDVDDPYHYPVIRVLVRVSPLAARRLLTACSWFSTSNTWWPLQPRRSILKLQLTRLQTALSSFFPFTGRAS